MDAGDAANLPYADTSFDKVFSVHTLYFWPDLDAGLREMQRVLRPGGDLLLAFHSSENAELAAKLPPSVYTLPSRPEVETALRRAGFAASTTRIDPESDIVFASARA